MATFKVQVDIFFYSLVQIRSLIEPLIDIKHSYSASSAARVSTSLSYSLSPFRWCHTFSTSPRPGGPEAYSISISLRRSECIPQIQA